MYLEDLYMNIKQLNEELDKILNENYSKKEIKEEFDSGNETYKQFVVQVDSEIEDAEPLELTGCDTEQEAENIYKTYQKQFKDVKEARWITLAKKDGCWYEQQKLFDLKNMKEV